MKNDATLMLVTDRGVTDGCWRQIILVTVSTFLTMKTILASDTNLIAEMTPGRDPSAEGTGRKGAFYQDKTSLSN